MPITDFYKRTRKRFPEITVKADGEQIRRLGEVAPEFAHSWFESLANSINAEMKKGKPVSEVAELFAFVGDEFSRGDKDVQDCIDVAFVENLFWEIPADRARPFWEVLPETLKALYAAFHRRSPL